MCPNEPLSNLTYPDPDGALDALPRRGLSLGLDGNEEPFVFGQANATSGLHGYVDNFNNDWPDTRFAGGALAHIRITSERQDFSRLFARPRSAGTAP